MPKLPDSFRAIAFDLDGTLIDTAPDLANAANRMLSSLGAPVLPADRIQALVGHGVERLVERALSESLGAPIEAAQLSVALAEFQRHYAAALFERGHVYAGVRPALHALQQAGLKLCCITNKDSRFALPLLEQADLKRYFEFTLCADRPEDRKPSPRLLLRACELFAVAPAQLLYVGDSTIDIAAANAAGCAIVAVSYGYGKVTSADLPPSQHPVDSLIHLTSGGAAIV